MIALSKLEEALKNSWTKETSNDYDRWSESNPAMGQCAVTALVVDDYLGGEIVNANVFYEGEDISHYFNIVDSKEVDFTRSAFPPGTEIPKGMPKTRGLQTTREYMLSYPDTIKRYLLLKERVMKYLSDHGQITPILLEFR